MKRIPLLSLVLALSALPGAASAATGLFCWSQFNYRLSAGDQTGQTVLIGQTYVNNSTVFSCSGVGNYTIPQLIAQGWKVSEESIAVPPVVVPVTTTSVTAYFRILIQKP